MHKVVVACTVVSFWISASFAWADDKSIIDKVKGARPGHGDDTIEQIINKASKIAHFIPRSWEVGQKTEGGDPVFLSWAKHRADKSDDEYSILWSVAADGSVTSISSYARLIELGWQAFALSLISDEASSEDENNVNKRFLHDLTNFNFVKTPKGKLGELLLQARCTVGDPVGVDYVPKLDGKQTEKGDFWRVQISVDCQVPGPRYFTRDGIIIFEKIQGREWEPQSFFAKRIANYPPGSWFDHADPQEQSALEAARKAYQRSIAPK